MERKIRETNKNHINKLYVHLGVQSLLDLKAMTGRVCKEDLMYMLKLSKKAYTLISDNLIRAIFFIIENEKKEYNLYFYSTEVNLSDFNDEIKKIFDSLQDMKISSIIYEGNKKTINILKKYGFLQDKIIKYGKENRKFVLLRR